MKNSLLFSIIILVAVIGGIGLFYLESQLPDNELSDRDINTQLLKIDNIDSGINELALRSRANLDANYDMLVRSTVSMERTIANLDKSYFHPDKISGSLLQTRFSSFRDAMVAKLDQVENFKSRNSVLRNSERYTPIVGAQLAQTAIENNLPEYSDLYKQVIIDVLEYTKQGSTKPASEVTSYVDQIRATQQRMPESSAISMIEFANHVKTAIEAKTETDRYLNTLLNSTANDQIEDILSAWAVFQSDSNTAQETLRYYIMGYVAMMLGLIGLLVFRLRSLYSTLDAEVEVKTHEVKKAYEELKKSESQLAQSEKMASLGQLVAGVAHEINTPLGYVTANVDTVKQRVASLSQVFESVARISKVAADRNRSKSAISELLQGQIQLYRKLGANSGLASVAELLKDTKEGLAEMQETVKSLSNFSHIHDSPTEKVDVNNRILHSVKLCGQILGRRKVSKHLGDDLPFIDAVPNQLTQVINNILSNAVHATDENQGVISIESLQVADDVRIVINDNGKGMDEETMKRVFDPFFTTRDVGQGIGLGLSIAHQIVDAQGGRLEITSELGKGTRVSIELPGHKVDMKDLPTQIRIVK